MTFNDKWERVWGLHFLKNSKNKKTIVKGVNRPWDTRDIKDYYSKYGADVERAQDYNPLKRDYDITIPLRKLKKGKYWESDKITDYIQFTDNTHKTLVYIADETIKKYKDNIVWNKTNRPFPNNKPWPGYTLEECKSIWNSYIRIPKSEVEVWKRKGSKGNWSWDMI